MNGWRVAPPARATGRRSAPRCCCAARDRCRGRSRTRRAGRCSIAGTPTAIGRFTELAREGLRSATSGAGRVSHLRIDPEIERDAGPDEGGAVRAALAAAGWQPAAPIQPVSTRVIDLAADEAALWGDLRKKWRQYVNKARTGGVRVVDAGPERLDEFYRIYQETADAGGLPDPGAVRLPRRLGRVRAQRARAAAVRRAARRHAGRDAVPRPRREPASWSRTAA